jgi:DNA-directed RNA polymerase subunit RPC12/RpoP
MPIFRCTSCERRVDSPVVIGAGDCPHCGGDVVFDIHGETSPGRTDRPERPPETSREKRSRLRRILGG